MYKITEIKDELKGLRGSKVSEFGQSITLSNTIDDDEIDVLDILDMVSEHEIDIEDMASEYEFDDVTDFMNYVFDNYKEVQSNNTYNWSAPIRNHINWTCYDIGGMFLFEVMVQRGYGDVRCNYTDYFYLMYDNVDGFIYDLSECDKYCTVEVDGIAYGYNISVLSDCFDVYDVDGEYVCTSYGDADNVRYDIIHALED